MEWIHEKHLTKLPKLEKKPFPHVEIDGFLLPERGIALLKGLMKEQFYSKDADLFSFFQTKDLTKAKEKTIKNFFAFLKSEEFQDYVGDIFDVSLNSKVDLFGSLYKNTHYLLPHDDCLEGRRVAFMYYLSEMPVSDGGSLCLYQGKKGYPTKIVKRVKPQFNKFVMFLVSKESFHEVEEVISEDKQRIAFGGWLHGN